MKGANQTKSTSKASQPSTSYEVSVASSFDEPKRPSIVEMLDILGNNIEELGAAQDRLFEAIEPILIKEGEIGGNDGKPIDTSVELLNKIVELNLTVNRMRERVQSVSGLVAL